MKYQTLAKITRPKVSGVLERIRLFDILDENLHKPVTWISSPGGSGKTVLVSSYIDSRNLPCLWYQVDEGDGDIASFFYYMGLAGKKAAPRKKKPLPLLTPEYLMGLSTFSKRYFENLFCRLQSKQVVVLDNFQEVSGNKLFDEIITNGLSVIPDGVRVILISRENPPKYMARLRASSMVGLLNWKDIKLTEEETQGIAGLRFNKKKIGMEAARLLHKKSGGWAAGLTLLLEGSESSHDALQLAKRYTPVVVFDYFANELFDKIDDKTKQFLLVSSFLSRMSAETAKELSGNEDAEKILSELDKRNFFIEKRFDKGTTYQFHPLFREFLHRQTQKYFNSQQLRTLQEKAAAILKNDDLENAVPLLIENRSWSLLTDAMQQLGPSFIAQGRHMTLLDWLQTIPRPLFRNHPWLLYWLASSQLPTKPDQSRENFIKAMEFFTAKKIVEGIFLSWASIIDTIVNQMADINQFDGLIDQFDMLRGDYADHLSDHLEMVLSPRIFAALTLRQPAHPDLAYWRDKVVVLFEKSDDPSLRIICGFYLLTYSLWVGDRTRAEQLLEIQRAITSEKNASPLTRLTGILAKAWYGWATGDHLACRQAVEEGLSLAGQSGVHVWSYILLIQSSTSALIRGNTGEAEVMLEEMATFLDAVRPMDRMYYFHDRAWLALLQGDILKAYEYQTTALQIASSLGAVYFGAEARYGMSQVCHARGDLVAAQTNINEARRLGEMLGSDTLAFQCDMADAQYLLDGDKTEEGLTALKSALVRVSKKGHVPFSWWRRDVMSRLCATALRNNIEPESACRIIRQHGLVPKMSQPPPESWPWQIKIYTLEPFRILVDDNPVVFSGKAKKKSLDILKALISFGGENVDVSQIINHLWPDADGDLAYKTFTSTLYRLRKLLGKEDAVQLQDGFLSLNKLICWTDIWAFEKDAKVADQKWQHQEDDLQLAVELSNKLIFMYHNNYLAEHDSSYVLPIRERLRDIYLKNIFRLGDYYKAQGKYWDAIKYFRDGLEKHVLEEPLYQKIMTCYLILNRNTDAIKTYNRCKDVLDQELGIEPSEQIKKLADEAHRTDLVQ